MYNEPMTIINGIILFIVFILLCLFIWIEYLSYKRRLFHLRESKKQSLAAVDAYQRDQQTDVGRVAKEMHQRLKKKELDQALSEEAGSKLTGFNDDEPQAS